MFSKKNINNNKKGFTLIETLVAVIILSIALQAFVSVVALGLKSYREAKDRYLATKIGQEGMELIINKRDNHVQCILANSCNNLGGNWQTNLVSNTSYEVDATDKNAQKPTGQFSAFNANHYLCIKDDGRFGYCTGNAYLPAKFTREVKVVAVDSKKINVITKVKWGAGKELVLQEILFTNTP